MQRNQIQIILHLERKPKIVVISSSNNYSKSDFDVVKINTGNKINLKRFSQN